MRTAKPAIPSVPKEGDDRRKFDTAVKECLEILMSRRVPEIKLLETTDTTSLKLNELLNRIQ